MTVSKNSLRVILSFMLVMLLMLTMIPVPQASALGLTSSATVTKGYSVQLKLTGADKATWSSSDKTVASVTSTGKVTGKSVGTAVITANVNGTKLSCNVKVVGGKLTLSSSSVTMDKGDVKYITVRAKGSHGIKAVADDKTIASTGWVTPWNKDDIRLKITAKKPGTTTVRVTMTKYPEITANITVKVNGENAVLLTSPSSVTTKVNENTSFVIYSDKENSVDYSISDASVAKISAGAWSANYCTVTVTGLKEGTATITVSRKDNPAIYKKVTVTVAGSAATYYTVSDTVPQKLAANDNIQRFKDTSGNYKYMLVPASYDPAKINSAISAYTKQYDYYVVYETSPEKKAATDEIKSFTATIGTQTLTRYIILPTNPDIPTYNTAIADYTGKVEYWTVYNKSPENKKINTDDVVKSWTTTVNYKMVTRYILVPKLYDETKLDAIIKSDAGTALGGYYSISLDKPTLKNANDKILTFTNTTNGSTLTYYLLVPANYDEGKANDAIAAFKGGFEYWTIYNTAPTKRLSQDEIASWTKIIDGKQVIRYMLLPPGYNPTSFNELRDKDLGTSSYAYYLVTTSYPASVTNTDKVWIWFNAKEGVTKYMLLPEKTDIIKRNEAVLKDTGVFDYYTIYSTKPVAKETTDTILTPQYSGGTVYMLVPKDYDITKVNQGLSGVLQPQ